MKYLFALWIAAVCVVTSGVYLWRALQKQLIAAQYPIPVVKIINRGHRFQGSGSVISVNPPLILTARHICAASGALTIQLTAWKMYYVSSKKFIDKVRHSDLCLIRLKSELPTTVTPLQLSNTDATVGDEVIMYGWPSNTYVIGWGHIRWNYLMNIDNWFFSYVNDVDIFMGAGSSGGPVLNEKGELVGVISTAYVDSNISRASSGIARTEDIRRFLIEQKVRQ